METALTTLQVLAALMYAASGLMKTIGFDRVKDEVPSFGALPRRAWGVLGLVELACVVGLIAPLALGLPRGVGGGAAAVLAAESLVFIEVHVRYREVGSIVMSGALGLLMAAVAYGRLALAL